MGKKNNLVDFTSLSEMLYGDEKYIKEVAEAAILSFTEFSQNYRRFLLSRDEVELRKAGHKIKPVAQMLGLPQIVEEYEYAKNLLMNKKPDSELEKSVAKMSDVCSTVITELKVKISSQK